ncbi:hypothetical protein [Arthrobacter sp. B3I4]|uniref:hypothetical protein n=1 Tax=Arthrobacter sp. B3I4 TaxID=3042267 RepID=UPI0027D846B4|nr:hypothetical protein [Arthrobacter sp. B3I4]
MGEHMGNLLRRWVGLAALVLLLLPAVSACLAEPRQPDLSTREEFARSVMTAALSGSTESLVALVSPAAVNARPEAQQLVDSVRGWTPDSWQLGISNDFPEVANVTARHDGDSASVRYMISWSDERWTLVMGESKNRPSGGAKLIGPGSDPKILPGGPSSAPTAPVTPPPRAGEACPAVIGTGVTGPVYGAAPLTCRTFTSTSGSMRGQNMYWLTSTPLHLSFDRAGGATALVVRMPCGVLNVPVSVDDFGLVPELSRMAESADGCAGPESEQRGWTTAFFKVPSVYRLDSSELTITSELGQIRFKQD